VRKLTLSLSIMGALMAPTASMALGLGGIDVGTTMDQPLRADIKLFGATPSELQGLKVKLAPPQLFEQVGIPRPDYLSRLHFKLVKGAKGASYIEVTTKNPVKQPFLDFLLEVSWPGGHLVREYTILLNPPNYLQGKPSTAVSTPQVEVANKPILTTTEIGAQASMAASSAIRQNGNLREYRVKRGDTLFKIASRISGGKAGIYQKMLAILKANPRAFVNGNINGLMQGYVLRIPSRSAMASIPPSEAGKEVARQNALWRAYEAKTAGRNTLNVPAANAVPKNGATPAIKIAEQAGQKTGPSAGHLQILGVETGTQKGQAPSASSAMPGSNTGSVAQIDKQLSLIQEATVSNKQQLMDLQSKLQKLQGIVEKQQKLIALKNTELASLQKELKVARAGGGQPLPTKPIGPVTTTASKVATGKTAATAVEKSPSPSPSHIAEKQSAPKPSETTVPPPQPPVSTSPGLIGSFLNYPFFWPAVGGAGLLLLVLLWLLLRRGGKTKEPTEIAQKDESLIGNERPPKEEKTPAENGTVEGITASSVQAIGEEETVTPLPPSPITPQANGEKGSETEEHALEEAKEQVSATDDILAEADVYIAYGLFQQAEDILKRALQESPERNDYRAKLLETYFNEKNKDEFVSEAQTLHDSIDRPEEDPLWIRVATMGKELVPDNPLFTATDTGDLKASEILSVNDELDDLDLGDQDLNLEEMDEEDEEQTQLFVQEEAQEEGETVLSQAEAESSVEAPESIKEERHADAFTGNTEEKKEHEGAAIEHEELNPEDDEATALQQSETPQQKETPEDTTLLDFDLESLEKVHGDSDTRLAESKEDELDIGDLADELALNEDTELSDLDLGLDFDAFPEMEEKEGSLNESEDEETQLDARKTSSDLDFEFDDEETVATTSGVDLLSGDTMDTNLDLAKAYIDMGDNEGARSALEEVLAEGTETQKREAEELLKKIK